MTASEDFIPILLYHSIADVPAAGQERFTVTTAAFKEQVKAIADTGRTALTICEMASAIRGERQFPSRPVAVTFDDGFADVEPAVELLLGSQISATVFVTAGTVDRKPMLSSAELRELASLGPMAEIGAHSVSHLYLDEVPRDRAAMEIRDSKEVIESAATAPVRSFAYPHGAFDRAVRQEVISAGFDCAAGVKNAFSHHRDDPFSLARLTITKETTTRDVEALLGGSGAPMAWRSERLRTKAFRAYRRGRRRLREQRSSSRGSL